MNVRAERAADTRRRILDAVRTMLAEGGFHEASMDTIAATAGVTRVTLYRTFGSKQALLEGVAWDTLAAARLDLVDQAHATPDVREAVRLVLRANCRMFADLGGTMSLALEVARVDAGMRTIVDATYHGRRHRAMERLAGRIVKEGAAAPGWTKVRITDALLVLSSHESFQTLVTSRGRSPDRAAATLFRMAGAFLADVEPARAGGPPPSGRRARG